MNQFIVHARYRHSPEGRTALKFAADLLKHLRGEKLRVSVDGGSVQQLAVLTLAAAPGDASALNANRIQSQAVLSDIASTTGLEPSQIELETAGPGLPPGAILVDHNGNAGGDANVLVPFDEEGLEARGAGPLLIPFGTDESGLRAAELGVPLAAALGREIVFYHTTWKDRTVTVSDPVEHMCEKAVQIGARLRQLADAAGVKHRTVVETAADVVLGTIRCAVRERANLIVMSREPKIIFGSYVDHALLQSVVPILIVRRINSEAQGSEELSEAERRPRAEGERHEPGAPKRVRVEPC